MITKIKQTILGIFLTVTATLSACSVAYAQVNTLEDVKQTCKQIESMASVVMKARQYNVPASKMMELAENELRVAMIEEAFSEPLYSSEEYKQKAIQGFANKYYMQCWKVLSNKLKNSKNNSKEI